jgi:hypothetical protein
MIFVTEKTSNGILKHIELFRDFPYDANSTENSLEIHVDSIRGWWCLVSTFFLT